MMKRKRKEKTEMEKMKTLAKLELKFDSNLEVDGHTQERLIRMSEL